MEIFGDVDALKKAISKKYDSKLKAVQKEKEKELAEIDRQLQKELSLLKSHMDTEIKSAADKAYSSILSGKQLEAKKEFEEKREELIEKVFVEADKKAKKEVHGAKYLDYVKKSMPKAEGIVISGDSDVYKKAVGDVKVDKSLVGVKAEVGGIVYDFTLNNLIASKKDVLRHEVSKVLFK